MTSWLAFQFLIICIHDLCVLRSLLFSITNQSFKLVEQFQMQTLVLYYQAKLLVLVQYCCIHTIVSTLLFRANYA